MNVIGYLIILAITAVGLTPSDTIASEALPDNPPPISANAPSSTISAPPSDIPPQVSTSEPPIIIIDAPPNNSPPTSASTPSEPKSSNPPPRDYGYPHWPPLNMPSSPQKPLPPYIPPGEEPTPIERIVPPEEVEMNNFVTYLSQNLSYNDYSNFSIRGEATLEIWCVNQANVEKVVAEYGELKYVKISYYESKYSRAELDAIIEEIVNSDFFIKNIHHFSSIRGDYEGIVIDVVNTEKFPEIYEWLETYPRKDMVRITNVVDRKQNPDISPFFDY